MTLAQIRSRAPTGVSMSCQPAPIVVPGPTDVRPRRITFGSSVTSAASSTVGVDVGGRRVQHRDAGEQVALVDPSRSRSASASWTRSLIPSSVPVVVDSTAVTVRPSARARATRSVRYSSPVAGDGSRSPIRSRSQAASRRRCRH